VPSHSPNTETSGPWRNGAEQLVDHEVPHGPLGLGTVIADADALAGGEAVGLHDVGRGEAVQRVEGLVVVAARPVARRRHAGGGHDLLGERLRPLDARAGLVGPEDRDVGRAQAVGHPGDQRCLRTDDDEVDRLAVSQLADHRRVRRVDVDEVGDLRDAGVAGRAQHTVHRRIARQPPRQRVLAPPASQDEDLHVTASGPTQGIRFVRGSGSGPGRPTPSGSARR
jgi:hypothetical protein